MPKTRQITHRMETVLRRMSSGWSLVRSNGGRVWSLRRRGPDMPISVLSATAEGLLARDLIRFIAPGDRDSLYTLTKKGVLAITEGGACQDGMPNQPSR